MDALNILPFYILARLLKNMKYIPII